MLTLNCLHGKHDACAGPGALLSGPGLTPVLVVCDCGCHTVCLCGHPRSAHEHLSEEYPRICSHREPRPGNSAGDPLDGVCMCLNYEPEVADAV